jgi:molybdate transport system substrate-binding protein
MRKILYAVIFFLTVSTSLAAQKITIFAASDLRFALDEIKKEFLKIDPKNEIEMIYGSSGKGMTQISHGAPYHLFFSADMEFVQKLYEEKNIVTKPKAYALGRVVIWSKHQNFDPKLGFENLNAPWVQKIAIANPTHAPYGKKAQQVMQNIGVYEKIKSKLVLGENISQATGFISSQSADIGIIALSLALAPTISNSKNSGYFLIDNKLHDPLIQGYGITKLGEKEVLAKKFYDFMQTTTAEGIMKKYGFGYI